MNPIKIKKICLFGAIGLFLGARAPLYAKDALLPKSITITGYAEKPRVQSDRANVKIVLDVIEKDSKKAYQKIQNQLRVLKNFLMDMGIKEGKFFFDHRYPTSNGYYSVGVSVPVNTVELAKKIDLKMDVLVKKGFIFSYQYLKYEYSKEDELREELTKKALLDGQNRARKYAERLGLSLGIPSIQSSRYMYFKPFPYKPQYLARHLNVKGLWNTLSVRVDMIYPLENPSHPSKNETVKQ